MYTQSTNPNAVELRRLQNRLSQRRYRSKLREARETAEKNSTSATETAEENTALSIEVAQKPKGSTQMKTVDTRKLPSFGHTTVPSPTMKTSLTGDMETSDDHIQDDPSWHHVYSILNLPGGPSSEPDSIIPEPLFKMRNFMPMECTCNSTAGPCPSHATIMQAQIIADSNAPQPLISIPNNLPQLSSAFSSPYNRASDPLSDYGTVANTSNHTTPLSDVPLESSPGARLRATSKSSDTEMTPRFSMVLEAIRQAGFQDFEELVLAYYSSRFEWGSIPAMLQSVSRSRRLKATLLELHKCSSQWPRWESRGLYESVSEVVVSLCVDEMDAVPQNPAINPDTCETAKLISSLEWLLKDQGGSNQSYSNTPRAASVFEQVESAPDSMPHLWSLLTELAGAHGLYSYRIARVLLTIIISFRHTQ
ncbi:hypothetical protein B0J11DRAFT_618834 [Dendryphion nanum]|uniref:BZIP domain-containing protein n=1 Tax=Dendryphion nanum TaxID=256645 RepID=A0A9P9DA85_9PLEO|nr:hypothetical protein B0J11DRAFT_618834 [Dendryphion nanum]